ncbi:MAG: hypothetical protein AABW92_01760, partial [Nanoarchaeota archaeon]
SCPDWMRFLSSFLNILLYQMKNSATGFLKSVSSLGNVTYAENCRKSLNNIMPVLHYAKNQENVNAAET